MTKILKKYFCIASQRYVSRESARYDAYKIGYYDNGGEWCDHNECGYAWYSYEYGGLFYVHNKAVTEEVEKWLDERNLDPDNLSEEDQLALSFYMRSL